MSEQLKENKQQKQPVNQNKNEIQFIPLKELTAEIVEKFPRIPFTFKDDVSKRGFVIKTIAFKLHETYLKEVSVNTADNKPISNDKFDLIKLSIDLPSFNQYGRPEVQWNRNVPVRFVKGKTKSDKEYFSMEMVFRKGVYDTHFFTNDQIRVLTLLAEKKLINIDWVDRPDAIEDLEANLELDF